MTTLLTSTDALWAALLVVLLPVLIIGAGEVQERLRQRGSLLEKPVATFRNWVLPLAALWILVVLIFDVSETNILSRAIATGALIAVTAAILQVVRYFTEEARARSKIPGTRHVPQLFMMVPRLVVLLIAGWLLFSAVWNVDLTGLFAALGVTSLVISLALQDTLSGLASGFLLLSDKPFEPGDWIEVNDIEGKVVDTNYRSSRIRDRNGDLIVIPNSVLAGATLVNFDQPAQLHRVVVSLQVAYSNPPTNATEMLLAAARATRGVLDDPPPVVRVVQIDDPLMGYDVQMWIDDYTISPRVKSDFGALVWYQSHRMDVPLPSPAFDLYHHDPIQEAADATLTVDQLIERIRRASIFSELNDTDIRELAEAAVPERFRRGETMLPPGVASREIFVLWSGRAADHARRRVRCLHRALGRGRVRRRQSVERGGCFARSDGRDRLRGSADRCQHCRSRCEPQPLACRRIEPTHVLPESPPRSASRAISTSRRPLWTSVPSRSASLSLD